MHFVVGFQFDILGGAVALICKNRPEAQRGKWNGIGGHVERGESAHAAMLREFGEETGVDQTGIEWREFARLLTWTGNTVSFFSSFTDEVLRCASAEEEPVARFSVADLHLVQCQANLAWLVAMALSFKTGMLGGDGREAASMFTIVEQPPWKE